MTRAAQALGFAGYPDLQSHFRRRFYGAVPDRLEAELAELGASPETAAIRVMLEDAETIRATAEDLPPEALRAAVDLLVGARRVFVFGTRGSFGLAVMVGIGLRLLLAARLVSQAAGDVPDQLVDLEEDDALVAISFRRFDRATVGVVRHAANVGARTVVITDRKSSPLARLADVALFARLGTLRLMPSYAAGASLVNAPLTATSLQLHDGASDPAANRRAVAPGGRSLRRIVRRGRDEPLAFGRSSRWAADPHAGDRARQSSLVPSWCSIIRASPSGGGAAAHGRRYGGPQRLDRDPNGAINVMSRRLCGRVRLVSAKGGDNGRDNVLDHHEAGTDRLHHHRVGRLRGLRRRLAG